MIIFDEPDDKGKPVITLAEECHPALIKVIGVGGGGCNAVNRMIDAGVRGVEFIAVNTDGQSLRASKAGVKIQLVTPNCRGKALGAVCDPEVGMKAALEATDDILEMLDKADMVFIAAGMGGGTGTGAAPVVASLAREASALTVAVVTKPFPFEGSRKARIADKGIEELRKCVDTLITVPNARLLQMVKPDITVENAFHLADEVLRHGVQGISDIINETGIINPDFADIRRCAAVGWRWALVSRRASTEQWRQRSTPSLSAAREIPSTGRSACRQLRRRPTAPSPRSTTPPVHRRCSPDCLFIPGYARRDEFEGQIQVTVVATGFGATAQERPPLHMPERPAARSETRSERGPQPSLDPASIYLPANLSREYGVNVEGFMELETPTYLRRQMD